MEKLLPTLSLSFILFTGCNSIDANQKVNEHNASSVIMAADENRTIDEQQYIDQLLAQDAANKKLEREYLREIGHAQDNNDEEAFKFFLSEFMNVPRLVIPEWMKSEPGYVKWLSDKDIKDRKF